MSNIEEAIDNIEATEKYLRSIGESWYADILSDAVDLLENRKKPKPCSDCQEFFCDDCKFKDKWR